MNDVEIPTINIAPLLDRSAPAAARSLVAQQLDAACRTNGFFSIVGHGIDPSLQHDLESTAHEFFASTDEHKAEIAMARAGSAWRGWFPVGGELTSGEPDQKEGIYFGLEDAAHHPRVVSGTALHGRNQFPETPPGLQAAVLEWLAVMRPIADSVMSGIALGLGMPADWFERNLTGDPTVLFRIFHYPTQRGPATESTWGVGEHTDYGLLTLLAQDSHRGLQVKRFDGSWIDVPPAPGVIICNLGDMLERLTIGRYRSTPHRVRNTSAVGRLSFPYFFDPSWDATVPTLPLPDSRPSTEPASRWDGGDVRAWEGTYGEYLTAKVAKVFPNLFTSVVQHPDGPSSLSRES